MHNANNKYCLECGKPRKSKERYCRHCGSQFPKEKHSFFYKLMSWVGLLVLLLILYYIVIGSDSTMNTERSTSTNTTLPPKVTEVVVNVYCPYRGEPMSFDSEGSGGSGTVMTDFGIVLTNSHVIPQNGEYISTNDEGCFVIFPDQNTGAPKEIYLAMPVVLNDISDKYDLAFLQINGIYTDPKGNKYGTYPKTFPALTDKSCDGKDLELGERILVYGYPSSTGGISLTVTEGVVSTFAEEGIYTSAKIDHGNSGGLATDSKGCFIGVPTAVSSGEFESYGIIVPSSIVSNFMDEVINLINTK